MELTYAEQVSASPNVVPFPTLPDRAVDERIERLVDQYASILRDHMPPRSADLEQDAAVRLWRILRDLRPSDVYRVAVANAIDTVRKARARNNEAVGADISLLDAISRLPNEERRAVEIHLQGFDLAETARMLRRSPAKSRRIVKRGMNALREILSAR